MLVYFLSGMCVNCKVFDKIELPPGFIKQYLEWHIPEDMETLEEYARKMAQNIDTTKPFIIIGYSLGGIVMQEMNHFLKPEKNILISSIKSTDEIPSLFRFAKKIQFAKRVPKRLYTVNKKICNLFTHLVYNMPIIDIERCVTYTSSAYMKWTIHQITNWNPTIECRNLYHIHGTRDQVFPYEKIQNVYTIEDGDHLMIMKKAEEVNKIVNSLILL